MNDLNGAGLIQTINLTDMALVSEEDLLDRARRGDKSAFGTLYLRHRDAARKIASMCVASPSDADDAVAEGFARVFAALPRMEGRSLEFRPYLLSCVRNAATDRIRRERRVDLRETLPDSPGLVLAEDGALAGLERNLVGEALQALPSRWRTVLWLTEVEGLSPGEVADRIGIKPNAVSALAYRARKGLREAYLQAHLRTEAASDCRATVSRLGNYVRGELPERERAAVVVHLDECAKCRGRRDELTDVNATLRNAFLPVPLLLAGMQRRWFQIGADSILGRLPEAGQLAAVVDSPLTHKALAGITMAVLALSGAAMPKLVGGDGIERRAGAEVMGVNETAAPVTLHVSPIDVINDSAAAALASGGVASLATGPAASAAPASATQAAASPAPSSRGRLLNRFRGDAGESAPDGGEGDTRQRFLPGPDDGPDGRGGILTGTLGPVVDSTAGAVAPGLDLAPVLGATLPVADQLAADTVNPVVAAVDETVGVPVDASAPVLGVLAAWEEVAAALTKVGAGFGLETPALATRAAD